MGMKKFNTTAVCIPSKHYMVDLSERVQEIKKLVDDGKYFTINRARQYGKTTTINALVGALSADYVVLNLSFERLTKGNFASEQSFVKAFCRLFKKNPFQYKSIPAEIKSQLVEYLQRKEEKAEMDELFLTLGEWCAISEKPIVMIIDEVDSATNNQVFLDFLGLLRDGYISRDTDGIPTFQSVILAGVTDVKHLRTKIRPEDEHKVNSPWNIAADFDIDMSLSEKGIRGMLDDYEADHHTGMDTAEISGYIRKYTNGYPYLVSRICQIIDEKLVPEVFSFFSEAWTVYGVDEAIKRILQEDNSFFDSVMGKLVNMPELKGQLRHILMRGETIAYLPDDEEQRLLRMYGFIYNNHNTVTVSNEIFEMRLYYYFIGESRKNDDLKQLASASKNVFINDDGTLNVFKIMEHFIREHNIIHKGENEKFLEQEGRERFLIVGAGLVSTSTMTWIR